MGGTKQNILKDSQDFIEGNRPKGILLFGSKADDTDNIASDIDICIVAGNDNVDEMLSKVWQNVGGKYDLWIFEELPIYIQAEIIDNHKIIYCESEPELYEYLYTFRKLIDTYRYRLKVAYGTI